MKLTQKAHFLLQEYLQPGHIVVDATLGNGHDALFLAQNIGETGQLYGFDIQAQAIAAAQAKLQGTRTPHQLFQASHHQFSSYLPPHIKGKVNIITYNLGYLPGGDPNITTLSSHTLQSLRDCAHWLQEGGVISLLCYPGHPQGKEESEAISQLLEQELASTFNILHHEPGPKAHAPILYLLRKEIIERGIIPS